MIRWTTLFLAVAGFVWLAVMGGLSLDLLRGAGDPAPGSAHAPPWLAGDRASALASRVELSRSLFPVAAVWAGLYLTSLVLCRALIVNGRSLLVFLAFVLLVLLSILLPRAADIFMVLAYLPACLVLLALLMRSATDTGALGS